MVPEIFPIAIVAFVDAQGKLDIIEAVTGLYEKDRLERCRLVIIDEDAARRLIRSLELRGKPPMFAIPAGGD